jgi:hypothetical protein
LNSGPSALETQVQPLHHPSLFVWNQIALFKYSKTPN